MSWDELLEACEERLAAVEHGLATGTMDVPPFTAPEELGPLPAALRTRAAHALRMTLAAQLELEAQRDRVADALRAGRMPPRLPAAYLDTRL